MPKNCDIKKSKHDLLVFFELSKGLNFTFVRLYQWKSIKEAVMLLSFYTENTQNLSVILERLCRNENNVRLKLQTPILF